MRCMNQKKGVVQGICGSTGGYMEKGWCIGVRSKIYKEYGRIKGSIFRYIGVHGDYL